MSEAARTSPSAAAIVGLGYLGVRLARRLANQGNPVLALGRDPDRHDLPARVTRGVIDLDGPPPADPFPWRDRLVFHLAPPPGEGERDERTRRLAAQFQANPPRGLVYVGTSGVYGDRGGAWVTETDPPNPQSARTRRRRDAEQSLEALTTALGVPVAIIRAAGIYGPGRLPLEGIRRGDPVLSPEESGWTNRIHVEDLASVCLAAAQQLDGYRVYNASDGQPGTMTDFYDCVADAAGLPRPPRIPWAQAEAQFSPMRLSFLRESRRLDNRRIREELGVELIYADLAEGVAASLSTSP